MRRLGLYALCLGLSCLFACVPVQNSVQDNAPQLGENVIFENVPGQTAIERFDPPGAGSILDLKIATQVKNSSDFGLSVKRIAYEIYLGDLPVGKGEIAPNLFVAAKAEAPLAFYLSSSLEGELELTRSIAASFGTRPLAFRIEGVAIYEAMGQVFNGDRRILVAGETLAQETLKPPELRLNDQASAVFMQGDFPVIRVAISALNPGAIGYFLYGKDLVLVLGNEQITTQDMLPIAIPSGQESHFELLFYPPENTLSPSAKQTLLAALEGIPTSLELQGQLRVDVLGVDSFLIENNWELYGFVY